MKYSQNKRAEKTRGLRNWGKLVIPFDSPAGLDYQCPICKISDSLQWSEYNGFIWCENCNKDIPSCFCKKTIEKNIEIFLDTIEDFKKLIF